MKNMVYTVEILALLDRGDVGRFLDHAHQSLVASGIRAIDARVNVSDVVADGAEMQLRLQLMNGLGESGRIIGGGAEDVKGEALCGFVTNSWKFLELVNETRHGFCKLAHNYILFVLYAILASFV